VKSTIKKVGTVVQFAILRGEGGLGKGEETGNMPSCLINCKGVRGGEEKATFAEGDGPGYFNNDPGN